MRAAQSFNYSEWQNPLAIQTWVEESIALSETVVYPGVKDGQSLSDEYLRSGREVINRQVVIGGLRLASIIKYIFVDKANEEAKFLAQ